MPKQTSNDGKPKARSNGINARDNKKASTSSTRDFIEKLKGFLTRIIDLSYKVGRTRQREWTQLVEEWDRIIKMSTSLNLRNSEEIIFKNSQVPEVIMTTFYYGEDRSFLTRTDAKLRTHQNVLSEWDELMNRVRKVLELKIHEHASIFDEAYQPTGRPCYSCCNRDDGTILMTEVGPRQLHEGNLVFSTECACPNPALCFDCLKLLCLRYVVIGEYMCILCNVELNEHAADKVKKVLELIKN